MADPSSYSTGLLTIVGSPSEHVSELAAYIDVLNGFVVTDDQPLGPITSQIVPLLATEEIADEETEAEVIVDSEKLEQALNIVLGAAAAFEKTNEKDFEPTYNFLIHVLSLSPAGLAVHLDRLFELLTAAAAADSATRALPSLTVLTNLFNILPPDSDLRVKVFLAVFHIAIATGFSSLLLPQLKQLPTWFTEWRTPEANQVKLVLTIANEFELVEPVSALKFFQDAHRLATQYSVAIPSEATTKLIVLALKAVNFVEYDTLLSFPAVSLAASTNLVALLKVFVSGTLEDFRAFVSAHPGFVASVGLSEDALTTKIRLLTLATLASQSQSLTLSYSSIAAALDVPADEVEFWVIDVIRAGFIEGKMSQLEQKLLIHRVAARTFGQSEWNLVKQRLDVWKKSLRDTLVVIKNARSQAETKIATAQEKKVETATATESKVVEVA
ncbi:hypothetical protein V1514DRAFT_326418 [Lipomyces japonicus]|uniref:uncharacterized protein n=1 Tax=Lipomyces japonicus TaxID=56871 RepID=UPI0034CD9222